MKREHEHDTSEEEYVHVGKQLQYWEHYDGVAQRHYYSILDSNGSNRSTWKRPPSASELPGPKWTLHYELLEDRYFFQNPVDNERIWWDDWFDAEKAYIVLNRDKSELLTG